MKILHPNKDIYLSLDQLSGYYRNGYYKIIDEKDEDKINYFITCFEDYRSEKQKKITDTKLYDNLPFSIESPLWKARQKDIKIIEKIIGSQKMRLLDIGSWNGWLCNYLSKRGHDVVGLGFFTDKFDGLGASQHYKTKFTSVQLVLDEIYRIKDQFDLIIFNRNWSYFKNQQSVFLDAKKLLSNNGTILFTGLTFHKDSSNIKEEIQKSDEEFKNKYNIPLFLNTVKGYLDESAHPFFEKNDIHLKSYNPIKSAIKSTLTKKPLVKYGVYKK